MQDLARVNQVLYRWIRLGQNGINVKTFLRDRGYHKIAIYGFTDLARCLIYELDDNDTKVSYMIDQQGKNTQINIPTYTLNDIEDKNVDAVICCYLDEGNIVKELKTCYECDVLTIEELLYEL